MMAKASMEIAHTVKIARRARRPMYASMSGPLGLLVLPVEGDRPRDPRRLAVRAVVLPGGDVAHVRLDHPHAHGRRPHADHADDVDLLGRDPPDVLAHLDPLLLGHAEGLLPLVHQLAHLRLRLLALRARR